MNSSSRFCIKCDRFLDLSRTKKVKKEIEGIKFSFVLCKRHKIPTLSIHQLTLPMAKRIFIKLDNDYREILIDRFGKDNFKSQIRRINERARKQYQNIS